MNIGAHVSIRGGLPKAPERAAAFGCECFQIFTRSPRGRPAKPIATSTSREFKQACRVYGQKAWYVHAPYYLNLASGDENLQSLSVRIIREELERGSAIGAAALMTHLGSAGGCDTRAALRRATANIQKVLKGYRGRTKLLVENAAGGAAVLGKTFEELSEVIDDAAGRCGICIDTQHAFASGYDLRGKTKVHDTLGAFDRLVGLEHLALIHCNDSKTLCGSGIDRHEHIGDGHIGVRAFRFLLNDPRLRRIDFVVETKLKRVAEDVALLKRQRRGR